MRGPFHDAILNLHSASGISLNARFKARLLYYDLLHLLVLYISCRHGDSRLNFCVVLSDNYRMVSSERIRTTALIYRQYASFLLSPDDPRSVQVLKVSFVPRL